MMLVYLCPDHESVTPVANEATAAAAVGIGHDGEDGVPDCSPQAPIPSSELALSIPAASVTDSVEPAAMISCIDDFLTDQRRHARIYLSRSYLAPPVHVELHLCTCCLIFTALRSRRIEASAPAGAIRPPGRTAETGDAPPPYVRHFRRRCLLFLALSYPTRAGEGFAN
jgi:hypothetical protein